MSTSEKIMALRTSEQRLKEWLHTVCFDVYKPLTQQEWSNRVCVKLEAHMRLLDTIRMKHSYTMQQLLEYGKDQFNSDEHDDLLSHISTIPSEQDIYAKT